MSARPQPRQDAATGESRGLVVRTVIGLAVTAAAVRLIPLQWLHPLNWDEIEFFRATAWIAEGRLPYRDFWEHHTPLAWMIFAPVAAFIESPGVSGVLVLRWAQIPVWIATFRLLHLWMAGAGMERFARWAATALVLCSSLFMIPAVEYRVDSVACLLYVAALVAYQRAGGSSARPLQWGLLSGALFCLCGFANIRMGPLLAVTVMLFRIVDSEQRVWRGERRANAVIAGAAAMFIAGLGWFSATGSLGHLYRQVWTENYLGDRLATEIAGGFTHRLLVPFGVRILGTGSLFELAAVDVGGIAVLLIGLAGMVRGLASWRAPGELFVLSFLQAVSLLFIASMKLVYNYHFEIVMVMMLPLVASVIERVRWRRALVGALAVAWSVNLFASVFRGKELDRAYQDLIMREAHERTFPGEKIWAGVAWTLQREPAYRFWFLPELARYLVIHGYAAPYRLNDLVRHPPALVIFDHYALVWLITVQRDLAPYLLRHYIPVWRNLWVPAMNTRLRQGSAPAEWIVPRDGIYRLYTSRELTGHLWFRDPFNFASYKRADADRFTVDLPPPSANAALQWWIDRKPASVGVSIALRRGQRIAVANSGSEPLAIILLSSSDRKLFRQPPGGATLDAETPRVTHVPDIGLTIPR